MKTWIKPEISSLNVGLTKNLNSINPIDEPHPWECEKCGKHHELKPIICGYNGCDGNVFKWACNKPEVLIS